MGGSIENPSYSKKEQNITKPGETPETVKNEAKEKTSKLKTEIIGTKLKLEEQKEAFNLAQNLAKKEGKTLTKEWLIGYQTKHKIDHNGRIGNETLNEMRAEAIIEQAEVSYETEGLSANTINKINNIIPKLGTTNKPKYSHNLIRLTNILADFKTNPNFAEKRKDPKIIKALGESEKVSKKQTTELENSEEGKTIYEMAKKGDIEGIIKNPTLLLTAGLLFLFGVIGSDTKYTDSFFKRIGWIMGGMLVGPKLWKELGGNEIIKDLKGVGGKVANNVTAAVPEAKEATTKFITDTLPDFWSNLKSLDFSEISDSIGNKIDKVTAGFTSYNKEFIKDGVEQDGYIKEKPLIALTGLMSDEAFLNLSKEDLAKIKDKTTLYGYIASEDLKKKINVSGATDTNIDNFLNKHLKNAFEEEKDSELVKDLFWTSSMKKQYIEKIAIKGDYIDGDTKLNKKLKKSLGELYNSGNPKIRNIGLDLGLAIQKGDIDSFKLENYSTVTEPSTLETVKNTIEDVKNYNEAKKEINKKVHQIEKIDFIVKTNLTEKTLTEKLSDLEKVELDPIKLHGFSTTKFEEAKKDKKLEIYKLAKDNKITTLGGTTVSTYLETLKKSEKITEDKKTLEKIEIKDIPTSDKSPVEFKKWYDENKENFETAERYKTNSNSEIKKLAENILKKKAEFKKNYEEMKAKYITKISNIQTEIDKITNLSKYGENKEIIQKQTEELEKITSKIVEGFTLTDITNFYKRLKGQYIPLTSDNSFIFLDKKLESTTKKPDLNKIAENIKDKIINIEKAFIVEIVNIDDVSTIQDFVKQYKDKANVISSFENDFQKEEKIKILEKQAKKITTLYINKINSTNNLEELNKIYNNFIDNVKTPLGGVVAKVLTFFKEGKVEKAYEEKMKELKLEEFGKKKVVDVFKNDEEFFSDYVEFLKEYDKFTIIEDDVKVYIMNSNNDNKTMSDFIQLIKGYKLIPQDKLKDSNGNKISEDEYKGSSINPLDNGFKKDSIELAKILEEKMSK